MTVHRAPSALYVLATSSPPGLTALRRTRLARVAARSKDDASAETPAGSQDGSRPPYEQARDELVELVKRLEAGGLTLEESLRLWERGEQLAAICEDWLEGARARLATALARREDAGHEPGAPF
jgi:exodeoxyribonuclease VII small subunit